MPFAAAVELVDEVNAVEVRQIGRRWGESNEAVLVAWAFHR